MSFLLSKSKRKTTAILFSLSPDYASFIFLVTFHSIQYVRIQKKKIEKFRPHNIICIVHCCSTLRGRKGSIEYFFMLHQHDCCHISKNNTTHTERKSETYKHNLILYSWHLISFAYVQYYKNYTLLMPHKCLHNNNKI